MENLLKILEQIWKKNIETKLYKLDELVTTSDKLVFFYWWHSQ